VRPLPLALLLRVSRHAFALQPPSVARCQFKSKISPVQAHACGDELSGSAAVLVNPQPNNYSAICAELFLAGTPSPCSDEEFSKQSRRQRPACAAQCSQKIGLAIRCQTLQALSSSAAAAIRTTANWRGPNGQTRAGYSGHAAKFYNEFSRH
jgi:hypothetical protein